VTEETQGPYLIQQLSSVAPRRYCACVLAVRLRGHVNTVQQPRPVAADSCQVELRPYTHEIKQWRISNALCVCVHFKNSNTCVTNRRYDCSVVTPTHLLWLLVMFAVSTDSDETCSPRCKSTPIFCVVFSPLQPSGHYMYHQFNIQQFCVQPSVLMCEDLRTNSDYFPIEH